MTFTWLGLYSKTGTPHSSSTLRIAPRACATPTALVALRPMNSSSIEASAGGFFAGHAPRWLVMGKGRAPSRPGIVTTVLQARTGVGSADKAEPGPARPGTTARITPLL